MSDVWLREALEEANQNAARYQKVRCAHRRLEVRYWTGQWWEPLTGENLDAAIDSLEDRARLLARGLG
jgi:hypothetical protein